MVFPKGLMRRIPDEELVEEYKRRKRIVANAGDIDIAADYDNMTAFNRMISTLQQDLRLAGNDNEKYVFYAYMEKILTDLIAADYRISHLRHPETSLSPDIGLPFYLDPDRTESIERDTSLYLGEAKNAFLIDSPMLMGSLMRILVASHNIALDVDARTSRYYPCWNLVVVDSGSRHRIADAYTNRDTCPVSVEIYEDWRLYDRITTDGAHWRQIGSGRIIGEAIHDYRLGVIFWLQARKFDIDPKRALDEMEENTKRFVLKENYDPRLRDAPISE